MKKKLILIAGLLAVLFTAVTLMCCGGKEPAKDPGPADATPAAKEAPAEAAPETAKGFVGKPGRKLLVAQVNFKQDDKGKWVVPDAGEMRILTPAAGAWDVESVSDSESNIFHKAIQYGKEGILTIGANQAMLKMWTKKDGKWTAETLWNPTFGGEQNRLRDFELADFDGDGTDELAIATHDQGVVAIAWNKGGKWEVQEIDRKADIFVHEIEVGDLDGNGKMELYATPSEPNTASGVGQGGGVLKYEWNGESFDKSEVVHYEKRHIKEVLVADVDGDGKQELYASLEAEMAANFQIVVPVDIVRFDFKDGKFEPTPVVTLPKERFCRFLTAGDVDHDGTTELVAAAFSTGVWVIEQDGGKYTGKVIDAESGGFEHAAYMADMNGDNKVELYVADDKHGALNQYIFTDGDYKRTTISKRLVPNQTMVWNITVADL